MIKLLHGDCLDRLRELPDNSVDACVTDPPYGLSFMGKAWDYDVPTVDVWREVLRVLKPAGHLLAFAGTRTQHRMAVRIEDAGFEIRDMIAWVYGSGFPKSRNLDGDWQGWGTALKPALEPITMARKPFKGAVAANVLEYGTGAINVDGCRVEGAGPSGLKPYTRSTTPVVYALGRAKEGKTVTYTDHPLGRWPANLIHDGSDEVVGLFPEQKSGARAAGSYRGTTGSNSLGDLGAFESDAIQASSGSAARFFYCAKATKVDREQGNGHPTVKPTELMRYLCRLVTPPGGIVLDPFMGSGSTGKAAVLEGFDFIGIEREPEYLEIARQRIQVPAQGSLL